MFLNIFHPAEILVLVGGAIPPPAPAVPASTTIPARRKLVQEHSSGVCDCVLCAGKFDTPLGNAQCAIRRIERRLNAHQARLIYYNSTPPSIGGATSLSLVWVYHAECTMIPCNFRYFASYCFARQYLKLRRAKMRHILLVFFCQAVPRAGAR